MTVAWTGGRIRIGASTQTHSPLSWMLRKFQKARVSHMWLLLEDALFDADMVLEASDFGYRLIPYERFRAKNKIVIVLDLNHPLEDGLRESLQWVGSHYNYVGLIGMAWVYVGRWFKHKWRNPLHSAKSMFCSEAVARILQLSKYPGSETLDPESMSPQDLIQFLIESKGTAD